MNFILLNYNDLRQMSNEKFYNAIKSFTDHP